MERIEGIKILQVDGLIGGGNGVGPLGAQNNFADGMVNSALRFRAQAPIVDQLLKEIGLQGGADINGMVNGALGAVNGAAAAIPATAAIPPIPVQDAGKKA
jgi:hypothetical protein